MTQFTREEEVRATFSLIIAIILLITAIKFAFSGSLIWIGFLIIAFAFAIPFIRVMIEQEQ